MDGWLLLCHLKSGTDNTEALHMTLLVIGKRLMEELARGKILKSSFQETAVKVDLFIFFFFLVLVVDSFPEHIFFL